MQVQDDSRPNTIAVGYRLTSVDVQKLKEIRQGAFRRTRCASVEDASDQDEINQIHLDLNLRA